LTREHNQPSAIGRKLARHNRQIADFLSKNKINPQLALNYPQTFRFRYGSDYDKKMNQVVYRILDAIQLLQTHLKGLKENTSSSRLIKGVEKKVDNLLHQLFKGSDDTIDKRPLSQKTIRKLASKNMLRLLNQVIELSSKIQNKEIFETVSNIKTARLFLQDLQQIKKNTSVRSKSFRVEQWDKSRFDTFLLGNKLSCCLATTGDKFEAIVQRWADDAMMMPVVIDEATNEPVCGAWLFLAHNKNKPNEVNVVANFLEIRATYARDEALRDSLVGHLLKYIGEYTKAINAKQFLIAPLTYGSIPSTTYFQKTNLSLAKVGGYFKYRSSNKKDYYLKSLKDISFYQYDLEVLSEHLEVNVLEKSKEFKEKGDSIARQYRDFIFKEAVQNVDVLQHVNETRRSDHRFMLLLIQEIPTALQYAAKELKRNFELVMAAIKKDGRALQYVGGDLKNNLDVVMAAVKSNALALEFASDDLKNNRDVVMAAVERNGRALQYASDDLRNDRDVVMAVVKLHPLVLQYASDELKTDRDVVIAAVKRNGLALEFAGGDLRNNSDVVLKAINFYGDAFQFASDDLRNNRDVVMAVVKLHPLALQYASDELKTDRDVVMAAVKHNGLALQYAGFDMRNKASIVIAAVKSKAEALKYASEELKNNINVVMTAIISSRGAVALNYIGEQLRNNREVVMTAVTHNGLALEFASDDLRNDREVVMTAIKENGDAFAYASDALKNDREIVMKVVEYDGRALQYASDELKTDRKIVMAAINNVGTALQYASDELKTDRNIVMAAINNVATALEYASDELKNDREVVIAAVKHSGLAFEFASDNLRNHRMVVMTAINNYGYALKHVGDDLKNNYEVVAAAVNKNGRALQYASDVLKNNRDIVMAALKNNGRAIEFASDALKNNLDIVIAAIKENACAIDFVGTKYKYNKTLRNIAAIKNDRDRSKACEIFLKNKETINYIDPEGNTQLHLAALEGQNIFVKLLLQNGAKKWINQANNKGKTPFHVAIENGNEKIVKRLLKQGADVILKTEKNDDPLKMAFNQENKAIKKMVLLHAIQNYIDTDLKSWFVDGRLKIRIRGSASQKEKAAKALMQALNGKGMQTLQSLATSYALSNGKLNKMYEYAKELLSSAKKPTNENDDRELNNWTLL